MFPPVKRVAFHEGLAENIPTPVIEESETDADPSTEDEHQRRREIIEAEDGHSSSGQGRRKRRREWIWRPMDDDVLQAQDVDTSLNSTEPHAILSAESDLDQSGAEGDHAPPVAEYSFEQNSKEPILWCHVYQ